MNAMAILSSPCPAVAIIRSNPLAALEQAFFAGRNERTIRAYRQDLEDFSAFLQIGTTREGIGSLIAMNAGEANATALAYKADMIERGLQPATVNRRLAALRSVVKLARTLGLVAWSLEVEGQKTQPYRDTRGPGVDSVGKMLAAAENRTDRKGTRDRAILRLMSDMALRRGEVVSLDAADVDLEKGTISILGKGRTARETLTMPQPTKDALADWITARGKDEGALFTNFDRAGKGKRLTGFSVERIVKRLGAQAGVVARPHGLRHTAITEALEVFRGDVRAVQKFSRHRDLRTLTIYDDSRRDMAGEVARAVASRYSIGEAMDER